MTHPRFDKGLHEIGDGLFAYLQPQGQWGYSNAGLIAAEQGSVLVDTLFDLKLTREMLDTMRPITGRKPIQTLINTHANGDHCWGNQLVTGAEIVASQACASELDAVRPAMLSALSRMEGGGELGAYLRRIFGAFDFEGIVVTKPTRTFEGELTLHFGSRELKLIQVGPAHTDGDTIVYLPRERVVFTGDIVFSGGTPVVWAGPIRNWVAACDRILALDIETVVPGHGPIGGKQLVQNMRDYLSYVDAEAERRFAAGMTVEEAARDIAIEQFAGWHDAERLGVNVQAKYRELNPDAPPMKTAELFALMAKLI